MAAYAHRAASKISIAFFDPGIDLLGKGKELSADKRRGQGQYNENDDDFRNECECHFLNLRQGLKKGDDDTDTHGGAHGRPRPEYDRPNRRPDDFESISLVHEELELLVGLAIVTPLPRVMVLPVVVVAVAVPFEPIVTDAIVPLVLPSAEVTDLPMTLSACESEEEVNMALRDVFVCTCCSTCENDASWLIY